MFVRADGKTLSVPAHRPIKPVYVNKTYAKETFYCDYFNVNSDTIGLNGKRPPIVEILLYEK